MRHEARGIGAIGSSFVQAKDDGRAALITYLTAGYPSPEATPGLVRALVQGGADIVELGVPFSDPVADGPAIQTASWTALEKGTTTSTCLDILRKMRAEGLTVPVLLMGYFNPILSYGIDRYVRDCVTAGVDGLIVPDLPPEEAVPLATSCAASNLALVYLVSPTTQASRVAELAAATSGFLYVVRRLGTTGADLAGGEGLSEQLGVVDRYKRTPVALGFGISSATQVAEAAQQADGVIIGSAIVRRAGDGPEAILDYLAGIRPSLAKIP